MEDDLNDVIVLSEAIKPLLETDEERASFEVRKGVTFVDYEIFIGSGVEAVDKKTLDQRRRTGSLEAFAKGVVYKMRNRRLQIPPVYNRKDLVREINAVLRGIVQEFGRVPLGFPDSISDYLIENRMISKYLKEACEVREKDQTFLDTPTEKIGIPSRFINSLKENGFNCLREIISVTVPEIAERCMGLGPAGVRQLKAEIERMGLNFKPYNPDRSWSRKKGARRGQPAPQEESKETVIANE